MSGDDDVLVADLAERDYAGGMQAHHQVRMVRESNISCVF
jgi:hypothetical protein